MSRDNDWVNVTTEQIRARLSRAYSRNEALPENERDPDFVYLLNFAVETLITVPIIATGGAVATYGARVRQHEARELLKRLSELEVPTPPTEGAQVREGVTG